MLQLGTIDIIEQTALKNLPQKAASAWSLLSDLVGASYKPISYVGTQVVKGVNHIFIAQQSFISTVHVRHIVLVSINEFNNNFSIVSIERIL